MDGVVNVGVRTEPVERQVFHLLVASVNLDCEVFIGVKRAKMRAAGGKFPFTKPELADGHDTREFEPVLPDVSVYIPAVIPTAANTAAGDDALHEEMEWARTKRAG